MINNNNLAKPLINNGSLQSNLLQNNINHADDIDLPRLGRKRSSMGKSVSFSSITVTKVENWKKYNVDMSTETEIYKLRQQVKEYKEKKEKLLKEQNGCCCEIF